MRGKHFWQKNTDVLLCFNNLFKMAVSLSTGTGGGGGKRYNSLHLARKYARKPIHGHHLLREANRITYSTYTQCDSNSECYHAFFDKPIFFISWANYIRESTVSFISDKTCISSRKHNLIYVCHCVRRHITWNNQFSTRIAKSSLL